MPLFHVVRKIHLCRLLQMPQSVKQPVALAVICSELGKPAGLNALNISLDTLKPDRFERMTRRRGLQRVLNSIWQAVELGFSPVKVSLITYCRSSCCGQACVLHCSLLDWQQRREDSPASACDEAQAGTITCPVQTGWCMPLATQAPREP